MSEGLSAKQRKEIEKIGKIPTGIKEWDSSLHFCPDWDYMLVSKHDVEADGCACVDMVSEGRNP